jgi:hypothetical protein
MKNFLLIIGIAMLASACYVKTNDDATIINKELLTGFVQKGPFINGSTVTIAELNDSLDQTGRAYFSEISDNSGKFEKQNIVLISKYALFKADGFYFNEITGTNSNSQITLNALADLSDENSVNVNLLTHLEKNRTEYLIKTGRYSFADAKKEAQKEILEIFSITKQEMANSENLDLAGTGDDNAILLAVSIIIQGYRSAADMSELIANIVSDIREDGVLTDQALGSQLISDVKLLDLVKVRANIEKKYQALGLSVVIPDFEKYVNMFIEGTPYISTKTILYPPNTNYGINILSDSMTTVNYSVNQNFGYSMGASLPVGTSLKIIMRGGIWWYRAMPEGPVNWTITTYNNNTEMQTFTATESGKDCDLNINFGENETITIEYYENNAVTPTKIKELVIK